MSLEAARARPRGSKAKATASTDVRTRSVRVQTFESSRNFGGTLCDSKTGRFTPVGYGSYMRARCHFRLTGNSYLIDKGRVVDNQELVSDTDQSSFLVRAYGWAYRASARIRATKAVLVSFVRIWTAELASRGIRANVISPRPTETPMLHIGAKGSDEGTSDYFKKMIPMGRLETTDEIASAAVFLASDESSFITAIDLPVDGGSVSR